jgi:hypothetical protein
MLEPIQKLNIDYSFYSIDKDFRPYLITMILNEMMCLSIPIIFGLCDKNSKGGDRKVLKILLLIILRLFFQDLCQM